MCVSLVRIARTVTLKVRFPKKFLPSTYLTVAAGQVLRVNPYDGVKKGHVVRVGGGKALLPEDAYDEEDGGVTTWVAGYVCPQ